MRGVFWQERRLERTQRLECYARRVAALRAKGLDIAMPALPPATGPYTPPPPPASIRSLRTRLSRDEYYALLDFWDCHDHDLAEAIRTVEARCAETWDTPDDVMPAYSLRRHCAYLAKVLGRRAVTRLFWHREEALADEAFRYEVGAKLWETVDIAPRPPRWRLTANTCPPTTLKKWRPGSGSVCPDSGATPCGSVRSGYAGRAGAGRRGHPRHLG